MIPSLSPSVPTSDEVNIALRVIHQTISHLDYEDAESISKVSSTRLAAKLEEQHANNRQALEFAASIVKATWRRA